MPAQIIPLASSFAGLNRMVSPQNLPESQSPDTTDARSVGLRAGALGPRNGRTKIISRTTDAYGNFAGSRPYYPYVGMGVLNAVFGKFRVLCSADGIWHSQLILWPGLNAVNVPADLTGMDSAARVRFLQYKSRLYAFNGRNRMRCLDGVGWTLAGIDKIPTADAASAGTVSTGTIIGYSVVVSGGFFNVTFTVTAHGFSVGDTITSSFGDIFYARTAVITAVTTNTLTVQFPATQALALLPGNSASGHTNVAYVVPTSLTLSSAQTVFVGCDPGQLFVGALVLMAITDCPGVTLAKVNHIVAVENITPGAGFYFKLSEINATSIGLTTQTYCVGAVTQVPVLSAPTVVADSIAYAVASNVATLTTAAPHNLVVGQFVWLINHSDPTIGIQSSGQSNFNEVGSHLSGVFLVASVPSSTTFTCAITTGNISSTTSGPQYQIVGYNYGSVSPGAVTSPGGVTGIYRYFITPANSKHLDVIGRPVEAIPTGLGAPDAPTLGATSGFTPIGTQTVLQGQASTIAIPATHPDPQVDSWNIYRNKSGVYDTDLTSDQQDFFFVGSVPIGTTSFTDTKSDSDLTGAERLRFDQNVPATFKYGEIYGDRMFGCGFDPINDGNAASVASDVVTFSTAKPDGVLGAWFKVDGDAALYRIIAVPSSMTVQLDRPYVGPITASVYSIFRYPWEIYFSEFQDVEAWGPDGEGLRFKIEVPGQQTAVGLKSWQGLLLVFTTHNIYAIQGKGPNATDVRMLPEPIGRLGALSCDAIVGVDNDILFLSERGPAALVAGTAPQLIGVTLNTDWIDNLTAAEYPLCCAGTDDKDVYFSVPSAPGQVQNSKTFRYERYTQSWWEETGMCPLMFCREDTDHGARNMLTYLQGEFVMQPNSGTFDLTSQSYSFSPALADRNSAILLGTSVPTLPTANLGLTESMIRFYKNNILVAVRRIFYAADSGFTGGICWSQDSTKPYSGSVDVNSYDTVEIGNVAWSWLSKTLEVPARLNNVIGVHATFDAKGAAHLYKTDIVDGVESTQSHEITTAAKAAKWPTTRANRDYAARIGSRDGATLRHAEIEDIVEADTQ